MDDLPGPEDLRSFHVPGDPASCHRTARRLHGLAGVLDDATGLLHHQSRVSPGLVGLSASAYRRRCALLGAEAEELGRRSRSLAGGLARLADALERAQALMARAERLASGAGLVVGGLLVPPTGPPSWAAGGDAAAWSAWSRARSQIRRARIIELTAQQAWSQLLLAHAAPHRPLVPTGSGPGPAGAPGPLSGPGPAPPEGPRDGTSPGADDGHPAPDLDLWTCGLTPGPDGFCGTPDDPLDPWAPTSPETGVDLPGVDLPGVLGRRTGAAVTDGAGR